MTKICIVCNKIIIRKRGEGNVQWNNRKFCSNICHGLYTKNLQLIIYCRICGTELNNENCYKANLKEKRKICIQCGKNISKIYRTNNLKNLKEKQHSYYIKNKTNIIEKVFSYQKNNPQVHKKANKKYAKTERGKVSSLRGIHKRRRNLEFIPLNQYFKHSHGHHVDKRLVIYIPKELNRSIPHNVYTGYNMEIINSHAYFFLLQQNIKELGELFV